MSCVRVRIVGDVQNVGFRSWTKHKADRIGVNGWVKNGDDGSVEAIFEADKEKVDEIIGECGRGPPGSYVEKVEVKEESPRNFKSFEIIL